MAGLDEGRVVIVTGAGRGLGRAEAMAFAQQDALVVVNNRSPGPAHQTVADIRALGGQAIASVEDVADFEGAKRVIETAINAFGDLHVLVNNAGVVRDRMIVNMTPDEWDEAIRVNLRGVFAPLHHAANYWRTQSKTRPIDAAVINTTSAAGLYQNVGQANYAAAKAGVANLTIIAAAELARYGVTVNAIAPTCYTEMTAHLIPEEKRRAQPFDVYSADNIAPLVVWLGSLEARHVTGRVFNLKGGHISIAEGWVTGPEIDAGRRWDPAELGPVVNDLVKRARGNAAISGRVEPA